MKKKVYFIVLALIITIGVIMIFKFALFNKKIVPQSTNQQQGQVVNENVNQDQDMDNFQKGNCDELTDYSEGGVTANLKSQCIKQKALQKDNIELCQTITKDYEKNGCISQIAEKRKDIRLCYTLNEAVDVDSCLSSIAQILKEPAICEEIKNENEKKQCLVETTDKCDSSSKEECESKQDCYWKYQGGKITAHYNCCPKDIEKSPGRCRIMVD